MVLEVLNWSQELAKTKAQEEQGKKEGIANAGPPTVFQRIVGTGDHMQEYAAQRRAKNEEYRAQKRGAKKERRRNEEEFRKELERKQKEVELHFNLPQLERKNDPKVADRRQKADERFGLIKEKMTRQFERSQIKNDRQRELQHRQELRKISSDMRKPTHTTSTDRGQGFMRSITRHAL